MLKIAVLISGRGSNMQALIDAMGPGFPAQVACVISNNPDAKGLDRAAAANIPTHVVNHRDYKSRPEFEAAVDEILASYQVQLVCLAGFMRLLTPGFVGKWRDKLINIHPSLLPAFPGLDTHKKAIDYGVKFAGCTVHFVRAEMDHGPIIMQASVPVQQDDDEAALSARILRAEHLIYPHAVRLIAENRVNIVDEKCFIVDAGADTTIALNPPIAV